MSPAKEYSGKKVVAVMIVGGIFVGLFLLGVFLYFSGLFYVFRI